MNRHDLFKSANVSSLNVHFVPGVLTIHLFVLHLDSDTHFHVMPKVRFFPFMGLVKFNKETPQCFQQLGMQ